jgi:hypothetical protein
VHHSEIQAGELNKKKKKERKKKQVKIMFFRAFFFLHALFFFFFFFFFVLGLGRRKSNPWRTSSGDIGSHCKKKKKKSEWKSTCYLAARSDLEAHWLTSQQSVSKRLKTGLSRAAGEGFCRGWRLERGKDLVELGDRAACAHCGSNFCGPQFPLPQLLFSLGLLALDRSEIGLE